MTDIKIDPDAMKGLVLKAILESWDDDTRNQLVTDALSSLMSEKVGGNSWDRNSGRTVFESIIRQSMSEAAHKVVREMLLENEELQQKIRDAATPLINSVFDEDGLYIDDQIAKAVVSTIKELRSR